MASVSSTTNALSRESRPVAPVVSVVMPTYNGERFLRPAIDSILNQTFREFEVIVIDDGSTDSTPRILADYKSRDARVIVLSNECNLGIAGATNRGLAVARGNYLALQDHDDISLPHRLQTQVDFLNAQPDIAVVGSAATLINDDGVPYAEFPLPCEEIDIKWRLLFHGDPLHYTSVMVRCSAMQEIGGYGEDASFRFSEAYDPFSRIAMRHRVVNLPQTLVLWRRHPDATSLQHSHQQWHTSETIAFRNLCLLDDLRVRAAPDFPSRDRSMSDLRYRHCLGFKAFMSTPAGQFPDLPPQQVVSGLRFFCDIQQTFYKLHRFPRTVVARHGRPLNWTWGKHAVALAIRAPWDWRSRLRIFLLGVRCLWHAACAMLIERMAKLINRPGPLPNLTLPTIEPIAANSEQTAWTKSQ
jgi:glycosyltransferase involved in cell wall biosynthesis